MKTREEVARMALERYPKSSYERTERSRKILREAFTEGYLLRQEQDNWISVSERLPEIIEDGYSDEVICVGHKATHPNEDGYVRHEIMSRKKLSESEQTSINWKGETIKYGWSNRWWDENPDLYNVTHWQPLPPNPKQ